MARRSKPITFRIFYGGKQVDKLPPEAIQKYSEILSDTLSRYCAQHPGTMEQLASLPFVEKIYPERKETET